MNLHTINPLSDSRWDDLVGHHPRASVFHERGWLQALKRTYGYEPLVLTSSPPSHSLHDGLLFCRVASRITGTRFVSTPFSDHCDPLLDEPADLSRFLQVVLRESNQEQCNYVELRPLTLTPEANPDLLESARYSFHTLDLSPGLERIYGRMHKNSMQRKVRRAEREGLSYEAGRSQRLIDEFYRLLLKTRKRHRLLPQPRSWFNNLLAYGGDNIQIRVARKNGTSIGAMLTLRNRRSVVYKYGCSDEKWHHLGAVPFLFWKLIEECKGAGAEEIDLGRSDLNQEGLITFKDRLGATRSLLKYYRYTNACPARGAKACPGWGVQAIRHVLPYLPDGVLSAAGAVAYRHLG